MPLFSSTSNECLTRIIFDSIRSNGNGFSALTVERFLENEPNSVDRRANDWLTHCVICRFIGEIVARILLKFEDNLFWSIFYFVGNVQYFHSSSLRSISGLHCQWKQRRLYGRSRMESQYFQWPKRMLTGWSSYQLTSPVDGIYLSDVTLFFWVDSIWEFSRSTADAECVDVSAGAWSAGSVTPHGCHR